MINSLLKLFNVIKRVSKYLLTFVSRVFDFDGKTRRILINMRIVLQLLIAVLMLAAVLIKSYSLIFC